MGYDILMTEGKYIKDQITIPLAHMPLVKHVTKLVINGIGKYSPPLCGTISHMALGRVVIFFKKGRN